ncbi:MAG: pentapeptide repeat-containing protein [Anaerolineae bacterium]|nr:pentapeptide repeat-containing protein [Anaerolineae bacterium]
MDFSQREYTDHSFKRVNYVGKQIERRAFDTCTFNACAFTETTFSNCTFRTCTFRDCDLRLAKLPGSTFTDSRFEQSKLTGITWTTTNWATGGLFTPVHFTDCDISYNGFVGLDLKKIQMIRCVAKDADFAEADMTRANCTGTDFTGGRFLHTNLTEADFTDATGYAIVASLNTLKQAKFALPEAIRLLYGLDIVVVGGVDYGFTEADV